MKTQYRLKSHVTREWLNNTKWDCSEWTKVQKTFWQKCAFDNGFYWSGTSSALQNLTAGAYFLYGRYLTYDDTANDFPTYEAKYITVTWDDIFEPTSQESPQTSETSATPSQYNYVKKVYKRASEALLDFEKGVELYVSVSGEFGTGYDIIGDRELLHALLEEEHLYTKVETPWYELVTPENPCYVFDGLSFVKVIGASSETMLTGEDGVELDCKNTHKPLTYEMVNDIVQTMKNFNGG